MMSSNPSTSHDYSFTTVLKTINISESLLMTGRHFENVQNREWLLSRVFFVRLDLYSIRAHSKVLMGTPERRGEGTSNHETQL